MNELILHLTELKMIASSRTPRGDDSLEAIIAFWTFSASREALSEAERLVQIQQGFSALLAQALKLTFALPERSLEILLNASTSTLERRRKENRALDAVASERLDRIATVSHLAEEVFESRVSAAQWLSSPNQALANATPIMLCETEIGARQVRRVLHALEWGGAA